MSKVKKSKSYKERLDPGSQLGNDLEAFNKIASLPNAEALGIDSNLKKKAKSLTEKYTEIMNIEQIAETLSKLGWCMFSRSHMKVHQKAAEQARLGNDKEANRILTDHWNSDNRLGVSLLRLKPLYILKEPYRLEIAEARFHVLKLALELHEEENYYASIPLVIAQLDGICADVTHEPAKRLFQKKFFQQDSNHLLDEETLEGHQYCLASLTKLFSEQVKRTELNDELLRHGIMHGRTLKYGTKENSTKLFVALEAFLMWAGKHVWRNEK